MLADCWAGLQPSQHKFVYLICQLFVYLILPPSSAFSQELARVKQSALAAGALTGRRAGLFKKICWVSLLFG